MPCRRIADESVANFKWLRDDTDVISPLIEIVDQFLAEDGVFVISGIIDTKEKEIADKLNAYGFDVIETRRMKDWVSMTAKMR